ncbi:MAG: 3'-5' exonuclease [Microbacteriaceae bacterium]|nr:3'-5' exonuclease [Cryobacterium sp.]MCC6376307.1 3'-5' exonuclease [Microbacteriaceae bacterium]
MAEVFVSVDVETAGPHPSRYSLLSIGACLLEDRERDFYIELKPVSLDHTPEAMQVSGLSMESLAKTGVDPTEAMQRFSDWLEEVCPEGDTCVFVGFNAAFDWMFVCEYFWRYLGYNPFGHSAFDIKSYSAAVTDGSWQGTSLRYLSPKYLNGIQLNHNALEDAKVQAELFCALRAEITP